MTELKRCPFCGGDAELFDEYWIDVHYAYVMCKTCETISDTCDTKERAIELWNTRPSPWHTGTPTEEGWYLIKYVIGKKGEEQICYRTENYKYSPYCTFKNMEWQKIQEK